MKALKVIALSLFCLLFPVSVWVGVRFAPSPDPLQNVTYADLITILLTGVTIVLAVLALVVAIIAIFGYQDIKEAAERKAREVASKKLDDYWAANQDNIDKKIEEQIAEILSARQQNEYPEAYSSNVEANKGEQRAAQDYPAEPKVNEQPGVVRSTSEDKSPPTGHPGEGL